MRLIALVCIFLIQSFCGFGQIKFFKIFTDNGYDYGQGVAQLSDSSYLLTGSSSSFIDGPSQAFLVKLDSLGNFLWSKDYGGSEADWGRRVLTLNDTIFYIAGYSNSSGTGSYNFSLIKTDQDGNQLMEKQYNHPGWDKLNDALITADSLIYMVGETSGTALGDRNFYVIKTDHNGDTLWTRNFGSSGDDIAHSIKQYNDTTFFIVGETFNPDSTLTKGAIIKLYANGDTAWVKEFGQDGNYFLHDFIFSGTDLNAVGTRIYPNGGDFDEYRLLSDINGVFYSEENIHSDGQVIYDHVCKYGSANRTFITSYFQNENSAGDSYDVGITRFYEDYVWDVEAVYVATPMQDRSTQIIPTSDGGAVVTGFIEGADFGGASVFIMKIGPNDDFPIINFNIMSSLDIESIVSVDDQITLNASELKIFPNPSSGLVTIKSSNNEAVKIEVVDLYGNIIWKEDVFNTTEIDVSSWKSAVYFVKVRFSETEMKVVKLIVY